MAKHWIAPDADYVCADADAALPFPEGTFEGIVCSDAFHYFEDKSDLIKAVVERGKAGEQAAGPRRALRQHAEAEDAFDLLRRLETHQLPGAARVRRLVDSSAGGNGVS